MMNYASYGLMVYSFLIMLLSYIILFILTR